jgi:two-component system cell cycle response regulator
MSTARPVSPRIYRVAFEGFSEFERSTLASFFRLADRHTPAYVQVDDPAQADLSVVDADDTRRVARLVAAQRINHAVFVGANAPADAIARVARPIEPAQILRALDQLVALRGLRFGLDTDSAAPAAAAVAARAPAAPVDLLLRDLVAPDAAPAVAISSGNGGGRAALVVDDSAIARKFLAARLQRFGYAAQTAVSADEAQQLAARQRFSIVFIDVGLGAAGGPDGLQLCRSLRQQPQVDGGKPPAVVLITNEASASERVRSSLAGGDGYLSKPLLEPEFIDVLGAVDPAFRRQAAAAG